MKTCKTCLLSILEKNEFEPMLIQEEEVNFIETQCEEIVMEVAVTEIPENSVVLKCPEKGRYYQKKQLQICDFLLLVWTNKLKLEVFFFELKASRRGKTKAKAQIQDTKLWLQECVAPQVAEQLRCQGLNEIQEHHVILFKGGKKGTTPAHFFWKYSARGKSDSPWPCSKHMLDGICCKMNAVSLHQIRDWAKA